MPAASIPSNESDRLRAVKDLGVLDSASEQEFDALVEAAAAVCGAPIALISLIDENRNWFKANLGLPGVTESSRDAGFCAHAILQDGIFEVADTHLDPRFVDNAMVTGAPGIRFYAGATLRLSDGAHAGTLCVIDTVPRRLDARQREVLGHLASAAAKALESRRNGRALQAERLRLHSIIEATGAGTLEWNIQTGEARFNEQWAAIIGYTLKELSPVALQVWRDRTHPDDLKQSDELLKQHLDGKTPGFVCDTRRRHRDGHWVWVRNRSRVLTWTAAGKPEWMFGILTDISDSRSQIETLQKTEQLLNRTGEVAGIGGWEMDLASKVVIWSDQTCRIHGVAPGYRPQLEAAIKFYTPNSQAAIRAAIARSIATGEGWDLELHLVHASGRLMWVRATCSAEFENAEAVRLLGAIQDVTAQVLQRQALERAHELLRVTLQSIGDAVITTDAAGNVTWLNPVAERMTGWLAESAKGRPLTQVFHIVSQDTRQPAENSVLTCLQQGKLVALNLPAVPTVLISLSGAEFGIEDSAAPIRDDHGELLGAVLVFRDVSERRRLSEEISHRATHDALTGLVNRTEFEMHLRRTLKKVHDEQSEHALLFINLDEFKLVNDAYGHSVGDELLVQVSKLLAEHVRDSDLLARLGGDEFAVIVDRCSAERALPIAQRICERMDAFRFEQDGRRFRVGTSIGLVPIDSRWSTTTAIVQAADASCYAAKEAGRNRVHSWRDADLAVRARHGEMQWATRLEQALDENRFVLHAQRIESLGEGAHGLHAEVLVRMTDGDGNLIPPGAFLPAAERFHLASRVDRWVLRHAINRMVGLRDLSAIDTLCINVSGQSIGDRAFHQQAIEMLLEAGNEVCRRICLEITETAAVTHMEDAAAFVDVVRAIGVRIALDDFGAGASSFGYLKTLHVDILKIDGQYIRNLVEDPLDDATVRCFVDVARVVGVKTVAEFVDRPEVLARVREIGIDFAQGFLLHKPEPIDLLIEAAQQKKIAAPVIGVQAKPVRRK